MSQKDEKLKKFYSESFPAIKTQFDLKLREEERIEFKANVLLIIAGVFALVYFSLGFSSMENLGFIPFLPLEFENQELVKLGLPVNEIRNIVTKIDGHSLTKQMRSYLPNVSVVVYLEGAYPGVLPAGEGHYFKFEGWVRNGFIYLPKFDAIQVSLLELSVEPDIVVDISDVLKLFEISGYERFIRENLSVLKIFKGGPNEITAEFKENALLHNLEYTDKLREKYPPKLIGGRLYSPRIEIVAAAERISGAQHLFRIGWITLHDFVVYLDDYGKLKPYRTEEVLPKPNRTIVAVLTVATIAVLLAIFAVIYKYKINPRK